MRRTPVLALLALAACGTVAEPGSNETSRILATLRGGDLQAAAFAVLQGQTRGQALQTLTRDGFDCVGTICRTQVIRRETDMTLRIGPAGDAPLQVRTTTFTVSVLGETVADKADISGEIGHSSRDWTHG